MWPERDAGLLATALTETTVEANEAIQLSKFDSFISNLDLGLITLLASTSHIHEAACFTFDRLGPATVFTSDRFFDCT